MDINKAIAAAERAWEAQTDRLHDEYYRNYDTCPECGDESVDGKGGKGWAEWWCMNEDCDYAGDYIQEPDDYPDPDPGWYDDRY
jgi:hypothetical protein